MLISTIFCSVSSAGLVPLALKCAAGPSATAEQRALVATSAELAAHLQTHHEIRVGLTDISATSAAASAQGRAQRRNSVPIKAATAISATAAAAVRAGVTWGDDVDAGGAGGGAAAGPGSQGAKAIRRYSQGASQLQSALDERGAAADSSRSRRPSLPAHLTRMVESFGASGAVTAAAAAGAPRPQQPESRPGSVNGPRARMDAAAAAQHSPSSPHPPALLRSTSVGRHSAPSCPPSGDQAAGICSGGSGSGPLLSPPTGRNRASVDLSPHPAGGSAPVPSHFLRANRAASDPLESLAHGGPIERGHTLPSIAHASSYGHSGAAPAGDCATAFYEPRSSTVARGLLSPDQAAALRFSKGAGGAAAGSGAPLSPSSSGARGDSLFASMPTGRGAAAARGLSTSATVTSPVAGGGRSLGLMSGGMFSPTVSFSGGSADVASAAPQASLSPTGQAQLASLPSIPPPNPPASAFAGTRRSVGPASTGGGDAHTRLSFDGGAAQWGPPAPIDRRALSMDIRRDLGARPILPSALSAAPPPAGDRRSNAGSVFARLRRVVAMPSKQ